MLVLMRFLPLESVNTKCSKGRKKIATDRNRLKRKQKKITICSIAFEMKDFLSFSKVNKPCVNIARPMS